MKNSQPAKYQCPTPNAAAVVLVELGVIACVPFLEDADLIDRAIPMQRHGKLLAELG